MMFNQAIAVISMSASCAALKVTMDTSIFGESMRNKAYDLHEELVNAKTPAEIEANRTWWLNNLHGLGPKEEVDASANDVDFSVLDCDDDTSLESLPVADVQPPIVPHATPSAVLADHSSTNATASNLGSMFNQVRILPQQPASTAASISWQYDRANWTDYQIRKAEYDRAVKAQNAADPKPVKEEIPMVWVPETREYVHPAHRFVPKHLRHLYPTEPVQKDAEEVSSAPVDTPFLDSILSGNFQSAKLPSDLIDDDVDFANHKVHGETGSSSVEDDSSAKTSSKRRLQRSDSSRSTVG